ncbi:MAG: AI-2E family transporter [Burkholderia sp.]|nr:AI-2E family transporter [Burkholderia sp.]
MKEGNVSHIDGSNLHIGEVNLCSNTSILCDLPQLNLSSVEIVSYLLMLIGLWLVLKLNLLSGLLFGMLVYQMIYTIIPIIERCTTSRRAHWFAVVLLSIIIVIELTVFIIMLYKHLQNIVPNIQSLFNQLMQIIEGIRIRMPIWIANVLPVDIEQMKAQMFLLIETHIGQLQQSSKHIVRSIGHGIFGMIIGAMVAIGNEQRDKHQKPLSALLSMRISRFDNSFRRIVFAQIKISSLNALFTSFYLFIVLPLIHQHLPMSKTLVLITFMTSLLPVLGNLISNTLIVTVSISVGTNIAITSLMLLVMIHKFEYFLNAKIIGSQIDACAWEILIAMIVMQSAFGITGLIAAPIFYAYLKEELHMLGLI